MNIKRKYKCPSTSAALSHFNPILPALPVTRRFIVCNSVDNVAYSCPKIKSFGYYYSSL